MTPVSIIPCIDVKDGRVVKGINFVNLRDALDPAEASAILAASIFHFGEISIAEAKMYLKGKGIAIKD